MAKKHIKPDIVEIVLPEPDASVATQQKSANDRNEVFSLTSQIDYSSLTNDHLHRAMVVVRNGVPQRCVELHGYAMAELIPACEAIIKRFKRQGVAPRIARTRIPRSRHTFGASI